MKTFPSARRPIVPRARFHCSRPRLEIMEERRLPSTITVTSAGDTIDPDDGVVTLREAITAANTDAASGDAPAGSAGLDVIDFDIPGTGVHTINLTSPLPGITEPIVIDGMTQPGTRPYRPTNFDGFAILMVEISGAALTQPNLAGLRLEAGASGSTIRGLIINRFATPGSAGVDVVDSNNNLIAGNFLGTDSDGDRYNNDPTEGKAFGNSIGVQVVGGNNRIGSPTTADRNLISGNGDGIRLTSTGASNTVQGNYIGTDATGELARGNVNDGVVIRGAAQGGSQGGALIGGATSTPGDGAGNVISGNGGDGVDLDNGAGSVLGPVTIQGNVIGLGGSGILDLDNAAGIRAVAALDSTNGALLIGGPDASARNVVSANGVAIFYAGPAAVVQGNYIGTDLTGRISHGNGSGIEVRGALRDPNTPAATTMNIGGAGPGEGNLISGSNLTGISVNNADAVIQGNQIGKALDHVGLVRDGGGVKVFNMVAAPVLDVVVGGVGAGAGNLIAFNGIGVSVDAVGVTILGNSIYSKHDYSINPTLGIEIGPSALAAVPQPPVLTRVTGTTIAGTLAGSAGATYRLEFFTTPDANDEGRTMLGATEVTTDAAGAASFSFIPAGGVPAGQLLTATATSSAGTSAFSQSGLLPKPGSAGLAVTAVALPDPLSAGADMTFVVTVTNPSPNPALNLNLTILPTREYHTSYRHALPVVSFSAPPGWSTSLPTDNGDGTGNSDWWYPGSDGGATRGFLPPPTGPAQPPAGPVGASISSFPTGSATFTLVVSTDRYDDPGGWVVSTTQVTADNSANPLGYSATTSTPVGPFVPPAANTSDLAATMTVSDGPRFVGDDFTFTIHVVNNGPDPAAGVVLTDVLPPGLSLVSSSLPINGPASPTLTAPVGDLTPGAEATWTLVVRAAAAGSFTNVAQVQGLGTDPVPANNTASNTALVLAVEPRVVSVVRNGVHWQPTSIVVAFNVDMDPVPAQNVANYRIQGPDRRLVPIRSATYDAADRSVTIRPVHRLNIHYPFMLTINGQAPGGLTDASGNLLDGAGNGQAGTDYQASVLWYGARTRVTPVHSRPRWTPPRTPLRPIHRAPPSIHAAPRFARPAHAPKRA